MAAPRVIRYLRRLADRQAGFDGRTPAIGRRRHRWQLLIDSGRVLMLLGALVLVHQLSTSCAPVPNEAEAERVLVLLGFLLWLLGAGVAMLALAARRFPALVAVVAGAVALPLRVYLFGGGV